MQSLLRRVESGLPCSLHNVTPAAQPFFAALIRQAFPERPVVVVSAGLKLQELANQDIQTWNLLSGSQPSTPNSQPLFFPSWEVLAHDSKLPHADVISDRLAALVAFSGKSEIANPKSQIVVANVMGLMQKTFDAKELQSRTRRVKKGDQIDPLDLIEWLEEQGYEPEAQVSQKGEISSRGGILDLWPLISPWPVRLEFFGNELESLRSFDPITQISREEMSEVTVPPGGELGLLRRAGKAECSLLDYLPKETIFVLCEPELLEEQARLYSEQVPAEDPFFISWDTVKEEILRRGMGCVAIAEDDGVRISPVAAMMDGEEAQEKFDALIASHIAATGGGRAPQAEPVFHSLEAFRPIGDRPPELHIAEAQRKEFFSQLHRWSRQDFVVHVFCNNDGERQRFEEVWWEYGLRNTSQLHLHIGTLGRGFIFEEAKVVVVTDAEIFGRYRVQRARRLKAAHAQTSRSLMDINFSELEEGDYVVHLQHGIGRFKGLQPMPDSSLEECLVIEYAPADPAQPNPKLYVPVTEAHLVGKYVGAGKARPQLNVLGGKRWAKAKAQAENAVRDLAAEMLSIHAARATQPGFAFPPDAPWQREFESSFLYEETPDQWRAIVDTKKDMETARPMDRLICGDVGFGKTEVAIRAGFKAALAGRQVAVLVPTTVLAQQHFNTFRDRMADYPLRIEMLSRFQTNKEKLKIIEDLAAGSVDIVIGTHRLVQKDVQFKDLGLVIIDEEQRFGVMHKEKFKRLRTMVDVLTLTATPIPRTLYMALAGARDMSTIETPPQDRLPVETIVGPYDERVVRDAIQREMNRGGQVFYLHNRVMDIEAVAMKLRTLLPKARIAVGHGQMGGDELEEVMTKFINGEVDVLLSTTIIESGLDIPNANTIIIDRADRFGLSDLYQLRGRVGRYKHQAYAYLLIPRHAGLLSDARKRIAAIRQYSTLGSGFRIAMRDLEIRGAGNLLGAQQSGHIVAVGFELYCQLLRQGVSALKGEKVKPRVETQARFDFLAMSPAEIMMATQPVEEEPQELNPVQDLEISVAREVMTYSYDSDETSREGKSKKDKDVPIKRTPAYLPMNYIPEARQRIEVYRKLAQTSDATDLSTLKRELRDRFGQMPESVELLLKVAELKMLASQCGVTLMETKGDKLMLTRNNDFLMFGGKFPRLTKKEASARLNEIKKLLMAL